MTVMPGFMPGIHFFARFLFSQTSIAATSSAKTRFALSPAVTAFVNFPAGLNLPRSVG
jgi:hypothetical protein